MPPRRTGSGNVKRQKNMSKPTDQFVILCDGTGDYIRQLHFRPDGKAEFTTGDASEAIRYTRDQVDELITAIGSGFSAESELEAE